jgi:hypothetical protein
MPINSGGGEIHIQGGYNDVARDMYYYTGNAVHRDHHINSSNDTGAGDLRMCMAPVHFCLQMILN